MVQLAKSSKTYRFTTTQLNINGILTCKQYSNKQYTIP